MFATLTGPWPPDPDVPDVNSQVAALLALQAELGLEPLSDGQLRWASPDDALAGAGRAGPSLAEAWAATNAVAGTVVAGATARAVAGGAIATGVVVKQAVPGPLSFAARTGLSVDRAAGRIAEAVAELAGAGCAVIEVEEPAAGAIGDADGRVAFVAAHRRLLEAAGGMHATLAIVGGDAIGLGPEALFAVPYHSYLFDLVGGPDNWRLIAAAPAERGIVCGALRVDGGGGDPAPLLAWAARYAAALGGRGPARVGLANAGSLAPLGGPVATSQLRALARAARLAGLEPAEAIAEGLDPRSFDARTAALGRAAPRPRRRPRRPG